MKDKLPLPCLIGQVSGLVNPLHELGLGGVVHRSLRPLIVNGHRGIDHILVHNLPKAPVAAALVQVCPHRHHGAGLGQEGLLLLLGLSYHGVRMVVLLLICHVVIPAQPLHAQPQGRGTAVPGSIALGADLHPVVFPVPHKAGEKADTEAADGGVVLCAAALLLPAKLL